MDFVKPDRKLHLTDGNEQDEFLVGFPPAQCIEALRLANGALVYQLRPNANDRALIANGALVTVTLYEDGALKVEVGGSDLRGYETVRVLKAAAQP